MKILIVDDTKEDLYLYEVILKGIGHKVVTASNGAEALAALSHEPGDLIISDVLMPEIDGFRLCKAVKKNPAFSSIPFVFFTATHKDEQDENLAYALGASKFLRKPIDPEKFIEEINKIDGEIRLAAFQAKISNLKREETIFTLYNERMIRKLEEKTIELELEIADRKKTEANLRRASRSLRAFSESNHALVRTSNEEDLLHEICKIIVETGGYPMAWILLYKNDGQDLIPVAKVGTDNCSVSAEDSGVETYVSTVSTILNEAQRNLTDKDDYSHLRTRVKQTFVAACPSFIVQPIIIQNTVIGGLVVWANSADNFDDEEAELLNALVDDMAFGINATRMRKDWEAAQKALHECEERYRRLVQNSLVGVFILQDDKYVFANKIYASMLSMSPEEIIGSQFWANFMEEDRQILKNALAEVQLGANWPESIETTISLKDGVSRILRVSMVSLEFNNRPSVMGNAIDITEAKLAEEKLKETLSELTASNDDLRQFAYVCSHDLQEPLRNVTNSVQILERRYKSKLEPEATTFINYAVEAAARATLLINDLLVYSRIGSGSKFHNVDCNAIVESALIDLTSAVDKSGAVITSDNLPEVSGNASQLRQLFQNLLSNAIKFRGAEKPKIHISVAKNKSKWLFSIHDNGIGIPPEFQDRIFLIFQRLHTRTEYPGTGIGLAISRKIVEQHGGQIWVESSPDESSTFFFTLAEAAPDKT